MMLVFVGASVLFHTRSSLDSEVDTTTAGLLVSMPRAIIFTSFLFALSSLRFDKRKTVGMMLIIVNTPIMLIANWPPSLPRFNLFGYILMILVVLLDFRSSKRRIMITLCFVIGAMFVMPLVGGLTRENKSLSEIRVADQIDSFFNGGDFDGLQSLNNAVVYVDRYGYEHGRQALSAVLFFVPRSIWSGKADPTGSIAADAAGFKFLNISEPLPGELYVDFGFWGVGVLSLLLGVELSKLDSWIDDNWLNGPDASIVGGLVVGYATILYRGSLLGVIGPVATVVLGGIVVMRFGFKRLAPVNYVHVTAA